MAKELVGPREKGIEENEGHQPTVFIIEDNDLTCRAMVETLVREGYQVLTAASGHDALGILQHPFATFDVVILDVQLPDASGIDICARLRDRYPTLPVIVCTGGASSEEVTQLLNLGIHRYFRKPIAPDELLSVVEAALP